MTVELLPRGLETEAFDPVRKLSTDLRRGAATLSPHEARYLVDTYYTIQEHRLAAGNQVRALTASEEPHDTLSWFFGEYARLEQNIQRALDSYSTGQPEGRWARSIIGIGPVIAAGLLAHIDIEKAPAVGHIWRFAGLDPTVKWGKGEKRPWNASLKVLCWKIGESFVKVSGNERDVYGKVYLERKAQEQERNEAGLFREQAEASLSAKRFGEDTQARRWYEQGKLPPARIHLRAQRYAVKLFLSHYHAVAYEVRFGCPPPKPYILEHGGHVHFIAPPGWPME